MQSFEDAYRRWWHPIFGQAYRHVGNPGTAEEIAQDVFLRAWERWDRLRTHPNLGGWLRVTCKNICLDHQRRAGRIAWVEYLAWRDDRCVAATPDLLTEQADTCAGWLRQLAALPPDQRRALRWAAADTDGPTIARRLGRTPGAVKLLLWRGRQTMRAVGWE